MPIIIIAIAAPANTLDNPNTEKNTAQDANPSANKATKNGSVFFIYYKYPKKQKWGVMYSP